MQSGQNQWFGSEPDLIIIYHKMWSKGYLIFVDLNKSIYRDIVSIGFDGDSPSGQKAFTLCLHLLWHYPCHSSHMLKNRGQAAKPPVKIIPGFSGKDSPKRGWRIC